MNIASGAYYAVIPAGVRYDPDLPANAKLLYGELTSLCNQTGYCWATNQYFAQLYGLTERTVSRLIVQLEGKGYIRCEMAATDKGSERRIYAGVFVVSGEGGIDKNVQTPPDKNVQGGVDKNVYQNNKDMNNKQDIPPYSPPSSPQDCLPGRSASPDAPAEEERPPRQPAAASVDKPREKPKRPRFVPPSVEQVRAYCRERGNSIEPETFVDYYASKGWVVGRSPMKDWRAAVRTWEQRRQAQRKEVGSDEDDWFQ